MKKGLLVLIVVSGYFTFLATRASAYVKPPVISRVSVTVATTTTATITWLTSVAADTQVKYGTTTAYGSLTTLDPTLTLSHSQLLSGLTPNRLYHFAVMSRTSTGILYSAGDFTFSTPPNIVDGMISGLNVSGITATSAVVSWTTPTPANGLVEFGTSISYGQSSLLFYEFVTAHTVVLSGLLPQTLYHFRVSSADSAGNLDISADSTFATAPGESTATFSAIGAAAISSTWATITWTTSYPATSQVDYGTGIAYGNSTAPDPTLANSHSQTLVGLTPNTLYHYRVMATGGGEGPAMSADYTFTTPAISVFYPQLRSDPNTYTGIAISNLDPALAQLDFTAFGTSGSKILAGNATNPAYKSLAAGAQLALIQDQLFGSGAVGPWPLGWTMVGSSTPHLTGFSLIFDTSLSFMDGADISESLLTSIVLPESSSQDYTKLLLANPNDSAASVMIDLVKADGTIRSTFQTSIPALGAYSADLKAEIFPTIVSDPSDYLLVSSSNGLISYEHFGIVARDLAVLAGQDQSGGATTLYSPQYVVGGPWNSTLSIVNLDSAAGTVTLKLVGDDGLPIGTTKTLPIAGNGKVFVSDPAFFLGASPTQLTEGYVVVTSSGVRLSGDVVFLDAAQSTFITSLPLVSTLQQSQVFSHIASNDIFWTGLAIVNPYGKDANVRIDVYQSSGQRDMSLTVVIPAGHRVSRLLTEFFPSLGGQSRSSGYFRITSDQSVACFGIFGTNSLSVVAAIPAQATP